MVLISTQSRFIEMRVSRQLAKQLTNVRKLYGSSAAKSAYGSFDKKAHDSSASDFDESKHFLTYFKTGGAKVYSQAELIKAVNEITGTVIKPFNSAAEAQEHLASNPPQVKSEILQRVLDLNQEDVIRQQRESGVVKLYTNAFNKRVSQYSFTGYSVFAEDNSIVISESIEKKTKKSLEKAHLEAVYHASLAIYDQIMDLKTGEPPTAVGKYEIWTSAPQIHLYLSRVEKNEEKWMKSLEPEDLESLKRLLFIRDFYKANADLFEGFEFKIVSIGDMDLRSDKMFIESKRLAVDGAADGAPGNLRHKVFD
ncbi:hypothetical protein WICANDRAFT_60228 [Wickerhamomyces anomalus NRRL Y-366-8]|uniref:Uncharacterized protein n=1 Tax=Wickerhamomyces anomalus (strain ATCC 58044 / CBS 1984 / NCYC 433 / NRRL Y-366-8) TaxID=683960 RepID=A0A1E3PB41_WICAA|nr:uncharacterized protein WICANDRAFT_60228 [Wickerhamomyces anomalus NRRL Y-366-8]ODQ62162.1 hypothetical protein WICANDRAFT_60228 [Wickerhamomyces anomalus NRRL Y-366-8]